MKKSILAVIAGIVFIVVVTTLVDIALHMIGIYPPLGEPMDDRLALLATAYRIVISVAGAWLTAWLAPNAPMRHAMALGYVGVLLGLVGLAATWDKGLAPLWYPVALVLLAVPQCWLGGYLHGYASAHKTSRLSS